MAVIAPALHPDSLTRTRYACINFAFGSIDYFTASMVAVNSPFTRTSELLLG